jgi:hypothetical protein
MEGTMALNLTLSDTEGDNQIEKYFNLNNKIKTINHERDVGLYVIRRFEYNEIVQLLIPNNALKSFENIY